VIPIEKCARCCALPQKVTLDYQRHDVRPKEADALTPLLRETDQISSEEWTIASILRCEACGTIYESFVSKDEGHSFMDPTCDTEKIWRLSPHLALECLATSRSKEAEAARADLSARVSGVVGNLATMLREERAPNWQIQKYAIEVEMDAALLAGDRERVIALLRHPDPVVRVDSAFDLLHMALEERYWAARSFTKALADAARQIVTSEDGLAVLAGVLAGMFGMPVRTSFEYSDDAWRERTTHRRAARALAIVAGTGFALDASLLDALVAQFAIDAGYWSDAGWALGEYVKGGPDRAASVLARLERLPDAIRKADAIASFEKRVRSQ